MISLRRPLILNKMLNVVQVNFPKLPMKAWYDEFPNTKRDVIEIARVPGELSRDQSVSLGRQYSTRKDITEEKLPQYFGLRSMDQLIVRDFAWESYKQLLAEAQGWDMAKDIDGRFEELYWGVSTPITIE